MAVDKAEVARIIQAAVIAARSNNYEEALRRIENALTLEPQNNFARSFKRRITAELEVSKIKNSADPDHIVNKVSEILNRTEELIQAKQYRLALEEVSKVYEIDPSNFYAGSYADRIKQLIAQEGQQVTDSPAEPRPQASAAQVIEYEPTEGPHMSHLLMYTELLKEFCFDGVLNEDELKELKKIREVFGISEAEHQELERHVLMDSYIEALRIAWRDGEVSKNEDHVLELMRQKYGISIEDHMSAEAKILWAKSHPSPRATVLVVDDEPTMLKPLVLQLQKHGYDVMAAESVEKALEMVEKKPPSLIVSDLMFPDGMSGLQLYDRVRQSQKLKDVPFLLMSGINDEYIVRAGMRMGVDNFIAKPFKLEDLLAVIEGRLKT
jgi:CheY-like chemotaxis protein